MAHKTFISYKYSESRELRDRIIQAMGSDAAYYTGETSESPDMSDLKTATIRKKLADMIYGGKLDAKTGLDLLMTAKYFERIGDHAVNIAEWVEYSITGQHRNNEHQDYNNN